MTVSSRSAPIAWAYRKSVESLGSPVWFSNLEMTLRWTPMMSATSDADIPRASLMFFRSRMTRRRSRVSLLARRDSSETAGSLWSAMTLPSSCCILLQQPPNGATRLQTDGCRSPTLLHETPSPSSDWTARQPHARGWLREPPSIAKPVSLQENVVRHGNPAYEQSMDLLLCYSTWPPDMA
jgi:hypothetical protein